MHGVYPWTLAGGVLVLLLGLVVLANGHPAGVVVAVVGLVLVVGSLLARASDVRRERHEELMAELRRQRDEGA